jgi:cell division protein FtsX
MPRRFPNLPDHLREPHQVEWRGFWRGYAVVLGVAILLGLVSGVLWIAWNLFRLHVLQ